MIKLELPTTIQQIAAEMVDISVENFGEGLRQTEYFKTI